jgi:hypothetical protein
MAFFRLLADLREGDRPGMEKVSIGGKHEVFLNRALIEP